ncbi:MAG: YitT family protein, partial [Pyramidobacter sp.]|nr:YitT family protein [Pyramidobacter sp.]
MKKLLNDVLLPYLLLTVGAAIAALALEEFLVPFQILDGGVVGVSMIVSQLTSLPLGLFIVALNIPFMFIGFRRLGKTFLIRALYAMLVFSVLLEVFKPLPPLTEQELLVVVFGGVLLGLGVGLILRSGGCLDGTEIVAMLLSQRVSLSTGQIVLGFNIVIYAAAGLLFGLDRALYSLLTYFITSKIIDMVQNGMEQGKAVTIITNEGRQIADALYDRLGR